MESFFYSQGFSKVTLQPEFPTSPQLTDDCNLKCVQEECAPLTCCNTDLLSPSSRSQSNSGSGEEVSEGVIFLSEMSDNEKHKERRLRRKQTD